jgi:hypothetical protein
MDAVAVPDTIQLWELTLFVLGVVLACESAMATLTAWAKWRATGDGADDPIVAEVRHDLAMVHVVMKAAALVYAVSTVLVAVAWMTLPAPTDALVYFAIGALSTLPAIAFSVGVGIVIVLNSVVDRLMRSVYMADTHTDDRT